MDPDRETVSYRLVIHGGAGTIDREDFTAEMEAEYRAELTHALEVGRRLLDHGGTALDAVEATVRALEDCPFFNAGKGAVFTADRTNELDASIMDGASGAAGAVAAVTTIKNPITAARAVMEKSRHVLLVGRGAEQFAAEAGVESVDPSYFATEHRLRQLEEKQKGERQGMADESAFGTVGAVALDSAGRLAAATSTGGLTNKRHGRVGDSPIVGAGTFADGRCAVSGTGHGEYFIRHAVAHEICARVRLAGQSVEEAAAAVVHDVLASEGGEGGVVAIGADGRFALPFNTPGMYRGWLDETGAPHVAIFGDGELGDGD